MQTGLFHKNSSER